MCGWLLTLGHGTVRNRDTWCPKRTKNSGNDDSWYREPRTMNREPGTENQKPGTGDDSVAALALALEDRVDGRVVGQQLAHPFDRLEVTGPPGADDVLGAFDGR